MLEGIRVRLLPLRHRGPTARPHGRITRYLRWSVGGLLIYALVLPADAGALADPSQLRMEVGFALTLALIFVLRLVWISTLGGGSRLPSEAPTREHGLSRHVHLGIYTIVFFMTLTGLVLAVTAEAAHAAFGFSISGHPLMPSQASLLDAHEGLAGVLVALIGLHVAGAAWHWLVRVDGVWRSIFWDQAVPRQSRRRVSNDA